ncbi:MAG: HEPN domain-containing protein [Chloroflexi bacterium]|nr:HEPN domain-containing protein [Chloroflexota bacterium]
MNKLTREWIDKAEDDWQVAKRESRVTRRPSYNAVCFHAQQCAEKYLKAYLQESGVGFPQTHNLSALLGLGKTLDPLFVATQTDLEALNDYSVDVRYPGAGADSREARAAIRAGQRVRKFVRTKLSL